MLVGSTFSGIGGFDLGLALAGHEHAFLCESDPYRQELLRARFPGTPVFEDVRFIRESTGGAAPDGLRSPADEGGWKARTGVLCGGFPCQDLSVAGKRAGLAGDRSGLFFEFTRIASFLRPRHVLLENVPGLFSSNGGRDFGVVLETLANLGYGVAWRCLDSRFFGVPQRRRRVFILGTLALGDPLLAAGCSREILAVGQSCGWHPKTRKKTRPNAAAPSLSGLGSGGPDDNDGQAGRLVTGPLLSNKRSGYRYDEHEAADGMLQASTSLVRRLTPIECERLQGFPDNWTQLGSTPDNKRYAALGDAVTVPVAQWLGERLAMSDKPGKLPE